MNHLSDHLLVFDNVLLAMEAIAEMEKRAPGIPDIMPPMMATPDPMLMGCGALDKDDFLATRLACRPDDVEYFRMLATDDDRPYLTDFRRYSLKPNLAHSHFLFRGQRKDYGSIKANLFRDKNKHYFLDDMIRINELTAFLAMHPLVQLLGIKGFELRGKPVKLQANLYGLAQHYYNRTTTVDLSSSLDVAAFFAVTRYADDTYLPATEGPEATGVIYALPIFTSLSYNSMFGYDISSIGKQFCFERPARQLGFLADCPGGKDLADHPLLLRFRFRHDRDITQRIYESRDRGRDIAPSDPLERYWRKYRDINGEPFSVCAKAIELNHYFNRTKDTPQSITQKLLAYTDADGRPAFRLSGKTWPEFPRELLEEYWRDIRNGWWQDVFCDNIYFPLEGRKHRDALLALPSDPRYRSAFFE